MSTSLPTELSFDYRIIDRQTIKMSWLNAYLSILLVLFLLFLLRYLPSLLPLLPFLLSFASLHRA